MDVPIVDLFTPELVDIEWRSRHSVPVRLKKNQICEVLISYLRTFCKKSFFAEQMSRDPEWQGPQKRLLITRPTNLKYELYCFKYYLQIVHFLSDHFSRVATLEEDLELLTSGEPGSALPQIPFQLRMAVVYRSEKKKILRSQENLVRKIIEVLKRVEDTLLGGSEDPSRAYTELLLEETPIEVRWREAVKNDEAMEADTKRKELAKLEQYYYYRRLINAEYFKQLKTLILSREYN